MKKEILKFPIWSLKSWILDPKFGFYVKKPPWGQVLMSGNWILSITMMLSFS